MKIAVCDEDEKSRIELAKMIKKKKPDAEIRTFASGKDLLEAGEYFEICFLDVVMKNISGIEVARQFRKQQKEQGKEKSRIVFVTDDRKHMEEAFEVNAYHYLLKPVDEEKISSIIEGACQEILASGRTDIKYIVLKCCGVTKKLLMQDILFVESNNKKVIFHTKDRKIETYGKMEETEKMLGQGFYRCHRCYLVNMEKITAYSQDTIQLVNGDQLILARKKYSDFVKKYMNFAEHGGIINC